MQIPLYKSKSDSIICLDDTPTVPITLSQQSSLGATAKYDSVLNDSVVVVETLEEGEIPPTEEFIPLTSAGTVSFTVSLLVL